MPAIADLLLGLLVPALLCGIVAVAVWGKPSRTASSLTALALAIGVVCAYVAVSGAPVLPQEGRRMAAIEWLPWIVAIAWVVAAIARALDKPMLSLVLVPLVIGLSYANRFEPQIPWGELALVVLPTLVVWALVLAAARRATGPSLPAAWVVGICAFAIGSVLTHSAKIGQIAGGVASGLGALAVAGFIRPDVSLATAPTAIVLAAMSSLAINASVFSDLPQSASLLFGLSLAAPWLAKNGREPRSMKLVFVRIALTLVPALVALFLAYRAAPEPFE